MSQWKIEPKYFLKLVRPMNEVCKILYVHVEIELKENFTNFFETSNNFLFTHVQFLLKR